MTDRTPRSEEPDVEVPPDAPEADLVEQAQPWQGEDEDPTPPRIPDDAPEADVLDQARPANLDDEERDPDL